MVKTSSSHSPLSIYHVKTSPVGHKIRIPRTRRRPIRTFWNLPFPHPIPRFKLTHVSSDQASGHVASPQMKGPERADVDL